MHADATIILGIRVRGIEQQFRFGCPSDGLLAPPEFLEEILDIDEAPAHVLSRRVRHRASRLAQVVLASLDGEADPLRRVIQVRVREGGRRLQWRWVDDAMPWKPAGTLPSPKLALAKLAAQALEQVLEAPGPWLRDLSADEVEGLVAKALRDIDEGFWDFPLASGLEPADGINRAERCIGQLFRRHPLLDSLAAGMLRVRGTLRLRVPVPLGPIGGLWQAARHADRLFALHEESPWLLPPCLLVAEPGEIPPDAAAIRQALRREGLSRQEWKLLANWPRVPLLKHLGRSGLFVRAPGAAHLARVLRFFHMADAMAHGFGPAHAGEAIQLALGARTRFPAIAERAAATLRVRRHPYGQKIAREIEVLDRRARACGSSAWIRDGVPWRSLVAESRGWLGARNIGLWEPPIKRLARQGFEARALRCAEELSREGREMRHCVARLANDCRLGDLIVFAIRPTRPGGRRATASYEMDPETGEWSLSELKGRNDQDVAPDVSRFAEALERRLNRKRA